jgi:murein DD-endopeptidase MepM/ murein hydrolase activator NlpD
MESGGESSGNLQSEVPGQPDFPQASRLWLATVTRQLKIRTLAIASRLGAGLDCYGPVCIDCIVSGYRSVLAVARAIHDDYQALARYVAHLAVLVMVLAALPIGRIKLTQAVEAAPPQASKVLDRGRLLLVAWTEPARPDDGYLLNAVVPRTTRAEPAVPGLDGAIIDPNQDVPLRIPEFRTDVIRPRVGIITYTVQAGDTVFGIAEKFDISPETILWSNSKLEDNPDVLSIDQEVVILPVSGVYHTVARGETLESIARKYKVDPSAIVGLKLNNVQTSTDLKVGQKLIVPGGQKPYIPKVVTASYTAPVPSNAAKGSGTFGWPVSGVITQKFWSRHPALDIGAPKGTPVYAADAGFVVYAGWSDVGYGYMVLIDHGNGYRTLYGHLSWFFPETGQSVRKGDLIGKVGCSGRCTGPHLHFEVIQNGVKRNPIGFLP